MEWLAAYSVKKLFYCRCVHINNVHMLISHQNWIFHYGINRISYASCYIFLSFYRSQRNPRGRCIFIMIIYSLHSHIFSIDQLPIFSHELLFRQHNCVSLLSIHVSKFPGIYHPTNIHTLLWKFGWVNIAKPILLSRYLYNEKHNKIQEYKGISMYICISRNYIVVYHKMQNIRTVVFATKAIILLNTGVLLI